MKTLKKYTILGTIFVLITGTLSHFVYSWTNENFIAGLFFPINESTWEHMKLSFFPMLFYSIYMNQKLKKEYPCILSALLSGILLSTFLIPIIFYTYTGIIGTHLFILDLLTFIISIILAFYLIYNATLSCRFESHESLLTFAVFMMILFFFIFTYEPLPIGLFSNPT